MVCLFWIEPLGEITYSAISIVSELLVLRDPTDLSPLGFSRLWDFPGKGTRVGCHSLPQGIFPTQGANPHVLHLPILYH